MRRINKSIKSNFTEKIILKAHGVAVMAFVYIYIRAEGIIYRMDGWYIYMYYEFQHGYIVVFVFVIKQSNII